MPDASPSRIGPYIVEREIGRGGMGVVHLARDERLDRRVAIKALPDDFAADDARRPRSDSHVQSDDRDVTRRKIGEVRVDALP